MRVCSDDERQKMFHPEEYLQPSQIASNFSCLTYLGKAPHPYREINDDDLLSAISMIDASEAIGDVLNAV